MSGAARFSCTCAPPAARCCTTRLSRILCELVHTTAGQSRMLVQDIALECSVSAMPTFQVWKNGQKVDELVGASKEKLKAMVEKHSSA